MTERTITNEPSATITLGERRDPLGVGRLGVYTALGVAAGVVPLPWVPDTLARRLRGAVAHDVVARHGLSLTPEARTVLAEPEPIAVARGAVAQTLRFVATRLIGRFTPLGIVPPLRTALHVYALGHLLGRYVSKRRGEGSTRFDADEARRVRAAIDDAVLVALRSDLDVEPLPRGAAPEDLRDASTQLLDGLIISAAGLPDWLVRRLEAAFDTRLAELRGGV